MGVAESNRIRLADLLAHIQSIIKGVDFEQRILKGDPAHEIIRLAEREKIDLIVMGTHGRRGLSRLLMGSVAEWVMRRANCPVLTVRLPEITPEETHATQSTAASQ